MPRRHRTHTCAWTTVPDSRVIRFRRQCIRHQSINGLGLNNYDDFKSNIYAQGYKDYSNISEDPEIKIEYDESIVYDPRAKYIGQIQYVPPNRMVNRAYFGKNPKIELLADLPREYQSYKSLFLPSTAAKLPPRRTFDHAIDLVEGAEPPFGPIYPLSGKQLEALRIYLDEMLKQGKIARSQSPAGAPILFVPKPDGRLRLCVDYRNLNKLTIHNKYPMPLMNELRNRVKDATIFTKLDLKDGYHLIRIKKGDKWKTAFRTRYGLYQYNVMPFGLVNAPATFQDMMNQVLREFLDQGVVVYLTEILIYSRTQKEHTELV